MTAVPARLATRVPLWPLTAVAGLAIVSTARVSPTLPVVIVLGIVAIAVAAFRPKAFVVVGLTVVALTILFERLGGAAAANADEAVVLLSVVAFTTRRVVTEQRVVVPPGTVPLLLFLAAGLVSSALNAVPLTVVLPAALIAMKAALYGFAVAQLHWTHRDLRLLVRAGAVAGGIVIAAGLINLVAPAFWTGLTLGHAPSFVGPIPALNGAFQHPAAMSRFCALIAVAALAYCLVVRSAAPGLVVTVATTVLSILTFEVKSLIGLVAAFVVLAVRFARPAGAAAFLAVAPLVVFLLGPATVGLIAGTIQTYVLQDSARLRLTQGAVDIANASVPFGAGFGRWGSSTAASDYSPLYLESGFENVSGLSARSPDYLNDTQWPGIVGETGWLGAALFALVLLLALASLARRLGERETTLEHWIRLAGVGWMLVLIVESIAAPVFTSTPSYPFLFLAVGIVASIRLDRRERVLPAPGPVRSTWREVVADA